MSLHNLWMSLFLYVSVHKRLCFEFIIWMGFASAGALFASLQALLSAQRTNYFLFRDWLLSFCKLPIRSSFDEITQIPKRFAVSCLLLIILPQSVKKMD